MSSRQPTTESRLRRRQMWRYSINSAVVLFIMLALADHLGAFGYRGDDWSNFDRAEAKVVRVIDGATVEVVAGERTATVRLIGLAAAKDSAHLESLVSGRTVRLKLETLEPRDSFGRLIAHIYLDDVNVNLKVITSGHARVDRTRDHSMRAMFEVAESQARKAKRGTWAD